MGSATSQITYAVPRTESGLAGLITVDAQPILGTSVAIETSSALQWDLHTQSGWMRLLTSGIRSSVPGSNQLLAQPKSLWALLSTGEYDAGTFSVTATETVSNSLVDSTGQYSFNDSKNW